MSFWSRSLFSFDSELKMAETTDSLSTLAPVPCLFTRLSTNSGSRFQRLAPEDPNKMGHMLAAVCLLLLDAPAQGTSGSSAADAGNCQGD